MKTEKIEYRGISKETGKWVFGQRASNNLIIVKPITKNSFLPDYHPQGMGWGIEDQQTIDRYEACVYGWGIVGVFPETVGICTHHVDKTGKRFCQGDIWTTCNDGKDGCDVWSEEDGEQETITWNNKFYCLDGLPELNETKTIYHIRYSKITGVVLASFNEA